MPRVKDISKYLSTVTNNIKKIDGINALYVWGSYAKNINNPNFRIKDIDLLVKSNFNSGDLIAIGDKILKENKNDEYLETMGYVPAAIKFSKQLIAFSKYNMDHWTISSDNKLLHWGPISQEEEESSAIDKAAEKYALKYTGYNRKKIALSAEATRSNWYSYYHEYMNKHFSDMPSGWYKSNTEDIDKILKKAIKI